jgi:hypothetical protein
MIKRRQFLLGGLAVIAIAGLGVIGFGRGAAEAKIATLVRRRLSFLRLEEAGLQAFAHEQVGALLAKRPTWNRMKYHFLAVFSKSFTRYNSSSDTRTRRERMVDNLASTYLLSSDFFLNKADASRVVQYLSLYDPLRPCGNPFARPPMDASRAEST